MKSMIVFLSIGLLLSGCATTEYYTSPNSAGYYEQALGGLCQNCNRQFNLSGYQLNNLENITCPYCGTAQNTQMAANRWTYAVQQQQAYNNQQAVGNFIVGVQQAQQQSAERRKQIFNTYNQNLQNINRPGSYTNPINVRIKD